MIEIRKISITDLKTDAIVNAANTGLWAGSGVCGAIFAAAGHSELQEACNRIGHCDTGSAVMTPAFRLKARYIIHAVGPQWSGGGHGEPQQLYSAYTRSLELALEHECRSIGFPLLSAGIFGYPPDLAWQTAIRACRDFLENHPETQMQIVFAVLNDSMLAMGEKILNAAEDTQADRGGLDIHGTGHSVVCFHLPDEPEGYLSNWYPAAFTLDGIRFTSAEQYIMYRKCRIFGDEASAEAVLATADPAAQQKIGRSASGYVQTVWEGLRQVVAFRGILAKFSQNEDLKVRLLQTGDAYLVECARGDKIWACGARLNEEQRLNISQWTGKNLLGFALMEVRSVLREDTLR